MFLLTVPVVSQAQNPSPYQGMIISRTLKLKPGQYQLHPAQGLDETDPKVVAKESGLIQIKGNGLTVDFTGVTLRGDTPGSAPDKRSGIAVEVSGNDITIKGLRVRGFKIGLLAKECKGLTLVDCDLSDNWKQHLLSTPEKEDLNDWQSYHHNEDHEWFRYGAGIYLDGCSQFEVRHCSVRRGQCGLMLNRCTDGKVWNCDFSFNSGLGIGMYRSSGNTIMNNRVDWNVRGYSYGVYNRGQDSADILLFEQCSHNIIAYNSMTHGGDGFFLWAGYHTMDTGDGGCNDNVVAYNDFSGAITNGIEATFSRNTFDGNLVLECWHGVWGGYSFDTKIAHNIIGLCDQGIAIEHGTSISIDHNQFMYCRPAISLWADPPSGLSQAYLQSRPSHSTGYTISFNRFQYSLGQPLWMRNTQDVHADSNVVESAQSSSLNGWIKSDDSTRQVEQSNTLISPKPPLPADSPYAKFLAGSSEFEGSIAQLVSALNWNPIAAAASGTPIVKPLPGGMNPFLGSWKWRGRRYVVIGPWGPYDFQRPMFLDLGKEQGKTAYRFQVLGPDGHFDITHVSGCTVVGAKSGKTGDFIEVEPEEKVFGEMKIEAQFKGMEGTDVYGDPIPGGTKVQFSLDKTYQNMNWTASYFLYDQASDPLTEPKAFARLLKSKPAAVQHLGELKFYGKGDWAPGVRGDHYVIEAKAEPTFESGSYKLDLISDDGAKVLIDGSPVQMLDSDGKRANSFKYQGATEYHQTVSLSPGRHQIEVIYFQIDGGRALQFTISPNAS